MSLDIQHTTTALNSFSRIEMDLQPSFKIKRFDAPRLTWPGLLAGLHLPGAIHKTGSPIGPAQGLLCLSTCHLAHESPYVMPRLICSPELLWQVIFHRQPLECQLEINCRRRWLPHARWHAAPEWLCVSRPCTHQSLLVDACRGTYRHLSGLRVWAHMDVYSHTLEKIYEGLRGALKRE